MCASFYFFAYEYEWKQPMTRKVEKRSENRNARSKPQTKSQNFNTSIACDWVAFAFCFEFFCSFVVVLPFFYRLAQDFNFPSTINKYVCCVQFTYRKISIHIYKCMYLLLEARLIRFALKSASLVWHSEISIDNSQTSEGEKNTYTHINRTYKEIM